MIRVIRILRSLDISLEKLQELVAHLDMDVSSPTNKLTQDEVNTINLLYASSQVKSDTGEKSYETDTVRIETVQEGNISHISSDKNKYFKDSNFELGLDMFEVGATVLFLAAVKWYYNSSNSGEYGFIHHRKLKDIHFRGSVVEGIEPRSLKESQIVVVTAEKRFLYEVRKRRVTRVNLIKDETNIEFLIFLLKYYIDDEEVAISVINALDENKEIIKNEEKMDLSDFLNKLENQEEKGKNDLFIRIQISKITGISFNQKSVSDEELFQLWKDGNDIVDYSRIKENIYRHLKVRLRFAPQMPSFIVLDDNFKKEILERMLREYIQENGSNLKSELETVLKVSKSNEIELSFIEYSSEVKYKLWKSGFNIELELSYFLKDIVTVYNNSTGVFLVRANEVTSAMCSLFQKLSPSEVRNLFALIHFNKDQINNDDIYLVFRLLNEFSISKELRVDVVQDFHTKATSYYKLKLFVDDFVDSIDYDDAVIYTGLLKSNKQKTFFKKILFLKETGKLNLEIDDLERILAKDYETSKTSEKLDGSKNDYSLSVIIHILKEKSQGGSITLGSIFQYVADIINDPKDIIEIKGFFDTCKGRTVLNKTQNYALIEEGEEEDKEEYLYVKERKEHLKPRFSIYCDGRKAFDRDNRPSLSREGNMEFYWCENSPCFETCRVNHQPEKWREYTLKDCFRIFDIPLDPLEYSSLIGYINKANRYFSHLNCRECGYIMHPSNSDNYGIYRVSNFHCKNENCEEKEKKVYLSHCANGQCLDIIDSRDSVRCKPVGVGENCGWYICNYCHACCSTSKLLQRKSSLNYLGRDYRCHTEGHKDHQQICCNKCGEVMQENEVMGDLYQRQLEWFIEYRGNHPNIGSYNQRADGKWWFKWEIGNLSVSNYRKQLKNLLINGFQIPDYHVETNYSQLISEPFKNISGISNYKCSCGNELILNDKENMDAHRKQAIMKYHFNKQIE